MGSLSYDRIKPVIQLLTTLSREGVCQRLSLSRPVLLLNGDLSDSQKRYVKQSYSINTGDAYEEWRPVGSSIRQVSTATESRQAECVSVRCRLVVAHLVMSSSEGRQERMKSSLPARASSFGGSRGACW